MCIDKDTNRYIIDNINITNCSKYNRNDISDISDISDRADVNDNDDSKNGEQNNNCTIETKCEEISTNPTLTIYSSNRNLSKIFNKDVFKKMKDKKS
jgi:hypothetical protein